MPKEKLEETPERIKITGLSVSDLVNPKLLREFEKEGLNVIPFMLGIDINKENVLTVTHNSAEESNEKIVHVDCQSSDKKDVSHLNRVTKILKSMVG